MDIRGGNFGGNNQKGDFANPIEQPKSPYFSIPVPTPPDLLDVLRKIEERGIHETVHRVRQRVGQVFRYGIATRKATCGITQDLRGALAPVVTQNYPAIVDPQGIAHLLRAIDGYQGQPVTAAALKLAPLLFVRPGELTSELRSPARYRICARANRAS